MPFFWPFHHNFLLSSMRKSIPQLQLEIDKTECEKERIQKEIDKYALGLISTSQHRMNKKYRAKLNKQIKELKRELELSQ